jgi:hypothetical protein
MNEKYQLYLRWLITPETDRAQKTQKDLIEYYNMSLEDIMSFETHPTFYQDLEREAKNWGIQKLPKIIQEAFKAAATGKPAAVRAFKELIQDSKKDGVTLNFSINPSEDQWARIVEREQRKLIVNPENKV